MKDFSIYIGREKGVLSIVDIAEGQQNIANRKRITVTCICKKCGSFVQTRLDRIISKTKYAENYCKNCRHEYLRSRENERIIGKTFGVLTVLSFEYCENNRKMYKCRCSRCGSLTVVRSDRFYDNSYKAKCCSNCCSTLHRENTKKRYQLITGLSGEAYEVNKKLRVAVRACKYNARARNIAFELSNSEVLSIVGKPCYYCGTPISNGIDRVDSKQGYISSNVVPCCSVCNIMKNAFTLETFMCKISMIYSKHFKEGPTTIENAPKIGESE